MKDVNEEPSADDAPFTIAAVGRYVLTPEIFDCIKVTRPGKGNELQLRDAIRMLIHRDATYAYKFEGTRYNAGDKLRYIKAIWKVG